MLFAHSQRASLRRLGRAQFVVYTTFTPTTRDGRERKVSNSRVYLETHTNYQFLDFLKSPGNKVWPARNRRPT